MADNRQTNQQNLTPWKFAGLMLTYWCNAECDFCYECCSPEKTFWAEVQQVVNWWQQLETLANRNNRHIKIHLTGGEPFGRWQLIIDILKRAKQNALPPVQKIETNAFWATDEKIVRERLETLKSLNVNLIVTDADAFHQEYVPIENVRLLVRCAKEILGDEGIRVRWWDFYNDYDELTAQHNIEELKIQALLSGRERLNGRAAIVAAKMIRGKEPQTFANQSCEKAILKSKHIHIDPFGYIFPGICCGIILGNAISENIAETYDWVDRNGVTGPILSNLVRFGPVGLMNFAKQYGFVPLESGYISKCQLCYHVRHFLYNKGLCRKWLGPVECYPKNKFSISY